MSSTFAGNYMRTVKMDYPKSIPFAECFNARQQIVDYLKKIPREKVKTLFYIPARGGSKGLPHKNIAQLSGRPLLSYAIVPALQANIKNARIMVDTDSEEICNVAKEWGAEVPFLRKPEFATDAASPGWAQNEFFFRLESELGYRPDIIVTMFVTSPFRTVRMIDESLDALFSGRATSITTAIPQRLSPRLLFTRDTNGVRFVPNQESDRTHFYKPCPLVMARWRWASQIDCILPLEVEYQALDIDFQEDLDRAERLAAAGVVKN